MAKRLAGRCGYPARPNEFAVTLHPDRLDDPFRWRKPRLVFVCSMGDLFHEDVPFLSIATVWQIMSIAHQHTYQVLTKRPDRMLEFFDWGRGRFPWCTDSILPNAWLGVTAENQEQANKRIPVLLHVPAAVRFVSVEPMLGEMDLNPYFPGYGASCDSKLDWVICGGETGPGARPMHPQWVRFLREQCQGADMPVFFKAWGDWCPESHTELFTTDNSMRWGVLTRDGEFYENITPWNGRNEISPDYEAIMYRIGKKAAGRLLDGRIWDEFPGRLE